MGRALGERGRVVDEPVLGVVEVTPRQTVIELLVVGVVEAKLLQSRLQRVKVRQTALGKRFYIKDCA